MPIDSSVPTFQSRASASTRPRARGCVAVRAGGRPRRCLIFDSRLSRSRCSLPAVPSISPRQRRSGEAERVGEPDRKRKRAAYHRALRLVRRDRLAKGWQDSPRADDEAIGRGALRDSPFTRTAGALPTRRRARHGDHAAKLDGTCGACWWTARDRAHPPAADLSTTMRYMHLSPASLNQAIRLLEQPGAADSAVPTSTRGESGETAPASEKNRKHHD